ncbi:hypothetical protein LBMAG42_00730 [Deltaproteobacteria bacterium]|nr:hypothetical protein LBMAG42_00730 [Deltaproteobacteria bacterium]
MNVRLCAAVAEELGELPGVALGVGPIAAAVAAGRLLAVERPDVLVLIGTAGAYPGGPAVGEVVVASDLGLASTARALGLGYVPLAPGDLRGDPELSARVGVRDARVLTAIAITTDPGLAAKHGERWEVEHMEAFSVAYACAAAGVRFVAILGITNQVGPEAHAEWLRNRAEVQRAVQRVAARLLPA